MPDALIRDVSTRAPSIHRASTEPVPMRRALTWCMDGLRLCRRAPLKLFLMCVVQFVVEGALQLAPWVGVTLSKVAVTLMMFGILLGLDGLARAERLPWSSLWGGLRRRPFLPVLAIAAIVGLAVFAVQQAAAWMVYGWAAVDAVWLGHAMAHPELMTPTFNRVLLLPGLLPVVLLSLAPCLFLFDGLSPWQAVAGSARMVLRFAAPFAVLLLVDLLLFLAMLAASWTLVFALLFTPWSIACMYVAWRDLRPFGPKPAVD